MSRKFFFSIFLRLSDFVAPQLHIWTNYSNYSHSVLCICSIIMNINADHSIPALCDYYIWASGIVGALICIE